MLMLLLGILFMGQYHASLIEGKLNTFGTETAIISATLSASAIDEDGDLKPDLVKNIIKRINKTIPQRIRVFNRNGLLIADSKDFHTSASQQIIWMRTKKTLRAIEVLKSMAGFVISLLPDKQKLPPFPETTSTNADNYPGVTRAIAGQYSLAAWENSDGHAVLSSTAPLYKAKHLSGAVLLTRTAEDINEELGNLWIKILGIFCFTLVFTVFLSIYLSGTITHPLRKLAKAADGIRRGKLTSEDMPDYTDRKDEIGDLSSALKEMVHAIWDRMDTIERFAADVSHELKNPLTSLRSALETLSVIKDEEGRKKLMTIISHDLERLNRLISDISRVSKLDSELSRDIYSKISVRDCLRNLINNYKDPLQREHGHADKWEDQVTIDNVTVKMHANLKGDLETWGHAGRLEQVFQNILSNALSFSPPNSTINIDVKTGKKTLSIAFEDEGPGIPKNKLDTIFNRFYTQRPDHEFYGNHSGLGLSICKQIITAMNGEIYAVNRTGDDGKIIGARFVVKLNKL